MFDPVTCTGITSRKPYGRSIVIIAASAILTDDILITYAAFPAAAIITASRVVFMPCIIAYCAADRYIAERFYGIIAAWN